MCAQPETVAVESHETSCDGGGGALGHPKVFLTLGANGSIQCPYCGKRFIASASGSGSKGH